MSVKDFPRSIISALIARTVGRVVSQLKAEVERAKEEISAKIKGLFVGIGLVVWSLCLIATALLLLFVAGLIALTNIWPAWLVALVGGGALLLFGLIFLAVGSSKIKKNKDLSPDEAIENIRSMFGG